MAKNVDGEFYKRADRFLELANTMASDENPAENPGRISAAFMYGAARFNSWVIGMNSGSAKDMAAQKEKALDHFAAQYRLMLSEHMDDHIRNWDGDREPADASVGTTKE